ncbi:MAG: serine/threonine protein kinase [Actinomycetota bacterium]|nr:serine/threonine protein kinase [Actinomycetota bacterium]
MVARSEPGVGDIVGGYRIDARLGEGAVGVVFRAVRESDGDVVALKLLKRRLGDDETFRARFAHEARAARHVEHDHLVPVLDAGEVDGTSFIVAGYVAGGSLEDRLHSEGPLELDEVLRLAAELGSGLDALHREGLVHRDVKPSNLMLHENGRAAITDFGLAKGPAYTVLTKPGQVMGTLDYLAPELIRGEPAAPASDIYALGCVMYECVTGAPPFGGRSLFELGTAHLNEEPPDPREFRPELPASASWALLRALEKEPPRRPPTAIAYASLLSVAARSSAQAG